MKKLLIILGVTALAACSKEELPAVKSLSVTGYLSNCDSAWKVLDTHVMIHWHNVTGADLARFQAMAGIKDSTTCPNNRISWWVVGPDSCQQRATN